MPSWGLTSTITRTKRFIARSPRARMPIKGCWSSWTGFWPDQAPPFSVKLYWRDCELRQPSTLVPFPDDREDEVSRLDRQNGCGRGGYSQWCVCLGGAQTEGVCSVPRVASSRPGQDPHLWPAGPEPPMGSGPVFLSGPPQGWEVYRYFSKAPGTPHRHTKPSIHSKGRKLEHTRGWWASLGYTNWPQILPCYRKDLWC